MAMTKQHPKPSTKQASPASVSLMVVHVLRAKGTRNIVVFNPDDIKVKRDGELCTIPARRG